MLETLVINGKMYQPSDEAALFTDQSIEYVERLARGKWIEASFVHGRCFVDIDSLVRFLATTRDEQALLNFNKEKQQQAENILQKYSFDQYTDEGTTSLAIIFQTGVVVLCGCLIGVISFTAVDAKLTASALKAGASSVVNSMIDNLLPGADNSPSEGLETGNYPEPPTINEVSSKTTELFSDNTEVIVQDDGSIIVKPLLSAEAEQAESVTFLSD